MDNFYTPGRNQLFVPGPVNIPDQVIRAMNQNNEDYHSPAIPALTKTLLEDVKKIFKTISRTPFLIPTTGTGAWESALTNTLSPGDRTVSFLIGQLSLLWIDQQQRLRLNVDVVESEWGQGANLDVLASKLAEDTSHTIKAVCIVHNETATGVTNNLARVRQILVTSPNLPLARAHLSSLPDSGTIGRDLEACLIQHSRHHHHTSLVLRDQAEKAKKEGVRNAGRVSDLLVDAVNGGVEESFINQKRIEVEIRALSSTLVRFSKQTDQWLAATHAMNSAMKEIGDFENLMKIMDFDCKSINAAICNIHQQW